MIKKVKYRRYDRDDPGYYGIKDIEILSGEVDKKEYYKPMLAKGAFNGIYKVYESRGDKEKNLLVDQYLDNIKPYLIDMINNHKNKEWKIQLNIYINFLSCKNTGET